MRIEITGEQLDIRLSRSEKILGLMRDITLPLDAISDAEVVEDPVREAMRAGMKVGLRMPWLRYVARTIRLDQAFIVRRGVPGLSLSVSGHPPLTRVLVSTPEAAELAARLSARGA